MLRDTQFIIYTFSVDSWSYKYQQAFIYLAIGYTFVLHSIQDGMRSSVDFWNISSFILLFQKTLFRCNNKIKQINCKQ